MVSYLVPFLFMGKIALSMCNRIKRIEQYKSLIKAFADPCDGVIYHYTSAEGFRGIIENSEIWLSNVRFVNDTTECRALQEETDLFDDSDLTNKYVRDRWRRFIRNPDNDCDTYIASFSTGQESLEQWRAYGNFRICFEANKLIRPGSNLYQCVYSNEEIKKWILEKEKVKEWKGDILDDQYKGGAAFNLIYAASKKYKNVYFEKEREVRLIAVSHHTWEPFANSFSMFEDDLPIHYRDHPTYKIPVPYVKFFVTETEEQEDEQDKMVKETARQMKERKFNEEKNKRRDLLPITEILIGPMLHKKEAETACKILLRDKGYESVKVNISNIPYRGF